MNVVYTSAHSAHAPLNEFSEGDFTSYLETPERAERIVEALRQTSWAHIVAPTAPTTHRIETVHSADYLHFLRSAHSSWIESGHSGDLHPNTFVRPGGRAPTAPYNQAGFFGFDTTPIAAGTWSAALQAAHCALTGADLLLSGQQAAYSLCRPPGHHAGSAYYGGYCYLNNAALAAQHLSAHGRVALLDIDFHHGNGSQDIFYTSAAVFFASLHGDPNRCYPLYWGYADQRGAGEGEGYTYNIPLPAGTDDASYLHALQDAIARITDFAPHYLVVSVGLDIYREDPLSDFNISLAGLEKIGIQLADCPWPTLLVQEGGYNQAELATAALNLLSPFAQRGDD
jgi:acetoin utilization deacetylase AcuC-like enzyme